MFRLTRFQLTLTLAALLVLRLTIGYHFFKEGVSKVKSGNFSAEGFISAAKGPLAPLYQKMIEDNDHSRLLCYDKEKQEVDPKLTIFIWEDYKNKVAAAYRFGDPAKVEKLKEQRVDDKLKIEDLRKEIAALERPASDDDDLPSSDDEKTEEAPDDELTAPSKSREYLTFAAAQDDANDTSDEKAVDDGESKDESSDEQPTDSKATDTKATDADDSATDDSATDASETVSSDTDEIDTDEIDTDEGGTDSDGAEKRVVPSKKELLQKQLDELIVRYEKAEDDIWQIREQRERANEIFQRYSDSLTLYLAQNKSEIETYFRAMDRLEGFRKDGASRAEVAEEVPTLNGQLNQIKSTMAGDAAPWISTIETTWDQYESEISELALEQDREKMKIKLTRSGDKGPMLAFVDKVIPWFDFTVGVLLFIGLFTRLAAIAAACFLASVISMQLPWVPNAEPTYYQFVELAGLLVLAATAAGRIAGLDYFINVLFWSSDSADEE